MNERTKRPKKIIKNKGSRKEIKLKKRKENQNQRTIDDREGGAQGKRNGAFCMQ